MLRGVARVFPLVHKGIRQLHTPYRFVGQALIRAGVDLVQRVQPQEA